MKSRPQLTTTYNNSYFDLTCDVTGAAAQVQGGLTQIAATEGCLNQWMYDSIWKMRVTDDAPWSWADTNA